MNNNAAFEALQSSKIMTTTKAGKYLLLGIIGLDDWIRPVS